MRSRQWWGDANSRAGLIIPCLCNFEDKREDCGLPSLSRRKLEAGQKIDYYTCTVHITYQHLKFVVGVCYMYFNTFGVGL